MHGRVKVRTTQEQEEAKQKKRQEKLQQYRLAMGAIQNMRQNGVHNEEGLKLTENLLTNNPDVTTLWNYRREILLALAENEDEETTQERANWELKVTEMCLRANPKSYGAWHHRCRVLETAPKADWAAEVVLCDKYLELDERNFLCWNYRWFVVAHAKVPLKDEIDFTTRKIHSNFSNYSSWHYRSRLLSYNDDGEWQPNKRPPVSEFELVTNAVFTDPGDQSAWIYLRWLLGKVDTPLSIERVGRCGSKGIIALSHEISLTADETDESASYRLQIYRQEGDEIEVLPATCLPIIGQKYSNLWNFDCEAFKEANCCDDFYVRIINVSSGKEIQSPILLSWSDQDTFYSSASPAFSDGLGRGDRNAVLNMHNSCKELVEMEPDSKWTHLTLLTTKLILNKHEMLSEILQEIEELRRIDPRRWNYYSDLRSRILVECELEQLSLNSVKISLSDMGLTALYHSQYFSFLRDVDLSKNKLGRSLPLLIALQSCEVLNLDENELESLTGFPPLPALRSLSLRNNRLTDKDELMKKATSCKALQHLDASGNPLL